MSTQHEAAVAASPASRVLVAGIDGVRWDAVGPAHTPVLSALGARGFLVPVRVNDAGPTISGPCWATMATGVLPSRHGVRDNDTPSSRLPGFPDWVTRVRAAWPAARTCVSVSWPPLGRAVGCGPIFTGPDFVADAPTSPAHRPEYLQAWDRADAEAIEYATAQLRDGAIATFAYVTVADETAHTLGTGADYIDAVERCDQRLGRLIAAAPAGTSIIVATDHGHVDGGGHGGDSDLERTAWIAACGPGIPGCAPRHLEQADIAVQALACLGIPADPAWSLDGRAFGARG